MLDTLAKILAPILDTLPKAKEKAIRKTVKDWEAGDHDFARHRVARYVATMQAQLDDDEAEARRAADRLPPDVVG